MRKFLSRYARSKAKHTYHDLANNRYQSMMAAFEMQNQQKQADQVHQQRFTQTASTPS